MHQITSHNSEIVIIHLCYWRPVGTLCFLVPGTLGFRGKRANAFIFPIFKAFLDIAAGRNGPFFFLHMSIWFGREWSAWNCFLLEVFLQRDINMWFINHWYFKRLISAFFLLVQHVDKVYLLSLLSLELIWLNMELAQAWVDSEAGLIQMLTVTSIISVAKVWKSILFICRQILAKSWYPSDTEQREPEKVPCLVLWY